MSTPSATPASPPPPPPTTTTTTTAPPTPPLAPQPLDDPPSTSAPAPADDDDDDPLAADDALLEASIRAREAQDQAEADARRQHEAQLEADRRDKARLEEEERKTWTETLYINNLNEKVKVPTIKHTLTVLFAPYGPLLAITAHANLRMRGQAFVAFGTADQAARAKADVEGLVVYGKPMRIAFATTRSDAVVRKLDDVAGLEAHLAERKAHKKKTRYDNPLSQKEALKRKLALDPSLASASAVKSALSSSSAAAVGLADEVLPPNATLFVQNLVDGVGKAELEELFGKYANLVAVRTIAARKDIAFVDYADEGSSAAAREGLNDHLVGGKEGKGEPMRVTFARK